MRTQLAIALAALAGVSASWLLGAGRGQVQQSRAEDPLFIRAAQRQGGRKLRADWQQPDAVVVTYAREWKSPLADLLLSASREAQAFVLVNPVTTSDEELREWLTSGSLQPDRVRVLWTEVDTAWVRDYGPIETTAPDGTTIWLDADYGRDRAADDAVPKLLAEQFGVRRENLGLDLDGGAIIGDGDGLCVATLDYFAAHGIAVDAPAETEPMLEQLGCSLLALVPSLLGDPTRHIDMMAQFLAPDLVAVGSVEAADSPGDAARLDRGAAALVEAARQLGKRMRVVRLPIVFLGGSAYRSYVNLLRVGDELLVPSYGDVAETVEKAAYARLAVALPDVRLDPVAADSMAELHGALHCIALGLTFAD
jgi:agmatine/peptidylarginine deiminase